ncbi:MAG: helix-turn-helix domain-containing protein [Anaerolineae bacterium]
METVGAWLRRARETRGSTLKEAEAATRIRARFLEALEAGDFALFPGGDVQIRGFLRIYARYLDLPQDEVLARYKSEILGVQAALPGVSVETQSASPAHPDAGPAALEPPGVPIPTPRPRWVRLETVMVATIVLIALLVAVAGVGTIMSRNSGEQAVTAPTATAPAEVVLPPTATLASPIVTPTFPANPEGGVALTLQATEHVWVRVSTDGSVVFEGMLASQQIETWSGQNMIIVDTGNGAGLLVTVNGQPQGAMCGRAQLCSRAWGPSGETAVPSPAAVPAP